MEAPKQDQHQERYACDKPVIDGRGFQVEAEQRRACDAAKSVLAAGHFGPAKRHRIKHRRERQRQQREIDAAPPQDQEAERHGNHCDNCNADDGRAEERIVHPVTLQQRGRVGREPKPGAVAKGHEAGMSDQNVQRHAGQRVSDDFGRRGHGEAEREQHRRQYHQPECGDQQRNWQALQHLSRLTRTG